MSTGCPYPFQRPSALEQPSELRTLRERPVVPVTLPSGDPAFLITRYEDLRAVLSDERVSRDLTRPGAARMTKDNVMFQDPHISPDPPEHTRMRRLITKAFTPKRVEGLRPRTEEVVGELLDAMEAGPRPSRPQRGPGLPADDPDDVRAAGGCRSRTRTGSAAGPTPSCR
ncbi:hypothetical protein GCM10020000_67270 [Streptomyces olivoverticillatus]